jgi:hypothetical protein
MLYNEITLSPFAPDLPAGGPPSQTQKKLKIHKSLIYCNYMPYMYIYIYLKDIYRSSYNHGAIAIPPWYNSG